MGSNQNQCETQGPLKYSSVWKSFMATVPHHPSHSSPCLTASLLSEVDDEEPMKAAIPWAVDSDVSDHPLGRSNRGSQELAGQAADVRLVLLIERHVERPKGRYTY